LIKSNLLVFVLLGAQMTHGSTLKILMTKDSSSPYSEYSSGDILAAFNKAVLGQLLTAKDTFELQPDLLKSWKWDSTDNSYELFLRENLTFHDGSPVKAEDLEFTLLRGFFSKQTSFYEIYLGNILGVDKIKPGTKFVSGLVKGVQITGPYSVKILLKSPNPSFLYSLATPFFSFVKKTALNDDLLTWKKWPVGAGPYMIIDETPEKISLSKRQGLNSLNNSGPEKIELYKQDSPKVNFDVSYYPNSNTPSIYKSDEASAIYTLFFTNQNELSKYKDFRQAISFGIDRDELIKNDNLSIPTSSFLTSAHWKIDKEDKLYDLEKAKYYFLKIPLQLREKKWKIAVFSVGALTEEKKHVTNRLADQFAKFGFKVEFFASNEKFLSKQTATDCPLKFSGRVSDNIDPLLMFASFKSNSAYRYDNAQNDLKFDKLYEEAAKAVGTAARVDTLKKLSKYTIDNNFMIPLYENLEAYYYNPNSVMSFGEQSNSLTLAIEQIHLK